jgi:penicillin-binding protein 1C
LFSSAQKIAWKTGTSFGFRDGWAIGLTPKYCVLVWIGNTTGEGRPDLTGINTAAPVLFDIFRALPLSEWFEPPVYHVTYIDVCHESGFKAGPECRQTDKILV